MPIYEYVCDDCGDRYEQPVMSRDTAITCPRCGSERRTLQLSAFRTPRNSPTANDSTPATGCDCTRTSCGCK